MLNEKTIWWERWRTKTVKCPFFVTNQLWKEFVFVLQISQQISRIKFWKFRLHILALSHWNSCDRARTWVCVDERKLMPNEWLWVLCTRIVAQMICWCFRSHQWRCCLTPTKRTSNTGIHPCSQRLIPTMSDCVGHDEPCTNGKCEETRTEL